MKDRGLIAVLLVPAILLLVPLVGMQVSDEWNWDVGSFVLAYALMAGVGLAYRWVTKRTGSPSYRLGAGLALVTAFLIFWISAAVGIIGAENPGNLLYGGVLLIGLVGACIARFAPRGMARALLATALAQMAVPVVAFVFWPADFSPGVVPVFALNAGFAASFAVSALLFQRASRSAGGAGDVPAVV